MQEVLRRPPSNFETVSGIECIWKRASTKKDDQEKEAPPFSSTVYVVRRREGEIYLTTKERILISQPGIYLYKWQNATVVTKNSEEGKELTSIFEWFKKWLGGPNRQAWPGYGKKLKRDELPATERRYRAWFQFQLDQFAFFYNRKFDEQRIFKDLLIAVSQFGSELDAEKIFNDLLMLRCQYGCEFDDDAGE